MKLKPTGIALFVGSVVILNFSILAGQEERRNPYRELGSQFAFLKTGDPLADWNSLREWTASDGRKLRAKILGVKDGTGQFLLPGNRKMAIPLSRFGEEDRNFVKEWQEVSRFFNLGFQKSRNVTDTVAAGISDGAFAKEGKEHETRNFRFICDEPLNALTVKDFSRLFEATYMVVRSLPLGLEVSPPHNGKFVVRLFAEKSTYRRAGGPENSAGVYMLKSREILVPLESLGLKRSGKTFRKAGSYDPSTLIHETTHAVTHQWLTYMPLWLAEGLAEYVAAIPYKNGTFYLNQMKHGQEKLIAGNFGGDATRYALLHPKDFVYLSNDEFMNRPTEPEKELELTVVEPFQIEFISEAEQKKEATVVAATAPPGPPADKPKQPMGLTITGFTPPAPPAPVVNNEPPSPIVVQRYSSSMKLLNEMISNGQVAALRKFLFAQLHYQWETETWLREYDSTMKSHQEAVKKQIEDFQKEYDDFLKYVDNYNEIVRKLNAGEEATLPETPVRPVPPEAIPVPAILANPRSSDQFAREASQRRLVEKYLKLPATLHL